MEACLTSTKEISEPANDIQIFPNPANQQINIISNSYLEQLNIYSQTGLKVLNEFTPGNSIDVSSLESGLYFIEINTAKNTYKQKLMIR
ncbi:MAG: T9SS type A sorting domain-containing protein [Bacteroidales bacterium]|nr:T9SS type A sorting domain-containing protein [Bacteroidales bacterium]